MELIPPKRCSVCAFPLPMKPHECCSIARCPLPWHKRAPGRPNWDLREKRPGEGWVVISRKKEWLN